jgi:hypothetical protein
VNELRSSSNAVFSVLHFLPLSEVNTLSYITLFSNTLSQSLLAKLIRNKLIIFRKFSQYHNTLRGQTAELLAIIEQLKHWPNKDLLFLHKKQEYNKSVFCVECCWRFPIHLRQVVGESEVICGQETMHHWYSDELILFNDAVSSADCVALNGETIS